MNAIIHVGDQKAGSKSIQKFMLENRRLLPGSRVFVSEATRCGMYHSMLASFALGDRSIDNYPRREWGITDRSQLAAHRNDVQKRIASELMELDSGIHSVLFSHEGLLSLGVAEIGRLMEMLRSHFSSLRIVAYIRRQDKQAVSEWGQKVKAGKTPDRNDFGGIRDSRSYRAMLDNWESAVGRGNISVRVLESKAFLNGCLYQDFCAAAGIPWNDQFARPSATNIGINKVAQSFLLSLNKRLNEGATIRRRDVIGFLEHHFVGAGITPSIAWAREILKSVADENEEVRRRYFPNQARLFDDSLDSYTDNGTPDCTVGEAFELAATMWEHFQQGPTEDEVRQAFRLVLGRVPTPKELMAQMQARASVKELYVSLLRTRRTAKKPAKTS